MTAAPRIRISRDTKDARRTVARKLRGMAMDAEQFKVEAPAYYYDWYRERADHLRRAADMVERGEG